MGTKINGGVSQEYKDFMEMKELDDDFITDDDIMSKRMKSKRQKNGGITRGNASPDNEFMDFGNKSVNDTSQAVANARSGKQAMSGSGGEGLDTAGSGLMMTGNPYAMAAGLGLKVMSMGQKKQQAHRELKVRAKQDRIERQQVAISQMIKVSRGLSNL